MCYYATTDYSCGDWKWGNMIERCPRQHRIGETCGAKLIHHESVTKSSSSCKICEEISTKQRRLVKTHDNIHRWDKEPEKFSASLEKARREAKALEEKIRDLHRRRPSVTTMQPPATSQARAPDMFPPLAGSYEYQSPQINMGRRQDSGLLPRNVMMEPMAMQNPSMSPYSVAPPSTYVPQQIQYPSSPPYTPAPTPNLVTQSMMYKRR